MKYSELIRLLKNNGVIFDSHGTRHDMYYSPKTGKLITVPRHTTEDVPIGTLNSILKDAGLK